MVDSRSVRDAMEHGRHSQHNGALVRSLPQCRPQRAKRVMVHKANSRCPIGGPVGEWAPSMRPVRTFKSQRGIGLVELMVGITIGLIVAAGASFVAVNQISEHRRLMLEIQLQQDLRTAADLLTHDLRRAGFRGTSGQGVWAPAQALSSLSNRPAQPATANPHAAVDAGSENGVLHYSYARQQSDDSADNGDVVKNNEFAGFKWDSLNKTLFLKIGNKSDGEPNWQPLNDPAIVEITEFSTKITVQQISAGDFCDGACGTGTLPSCPSLQVRDVTFKIVGTAAHDRSVVRTITAVERVKTDALTARCPT